ncbi:hypothetical protein FNV43_RR26189 [Rhamnella rubrinervis]|uniref:Glutathione S-transferase n=1 Tax=Rhamnella rubrinervis TaxID=2594499 RepID=A0A8K0GP14_9ROSA|nr:hypothetical protein FNV43_RR26189 [Rhamnella rubrinervis]
MEGQQSEVVLFGTWASAYCTRIHLALKLKGIPYEYVEEDLGNKSESLLYYNPVHKKVPVLVHKGKAIAESLVILEYIDECWTNTPRLLPEDPYERAKVRFWVDFYDKKVTAGSLSIFKSKGKEQEKAIEDMVELLRVFEEGMKKDFPGKFPFFNGETLGLVDIVVASVACNYLAVHEVVSEVISPKNNPDFLAWVDALKEHPVVKDTLPPHDKLVADLRERFFSSGY